MSIRNFRLSRTTKLNLPTKIHQPKHLIRVSILSYKQIRLISSYSLPMFFFAFLLLIAVSELPAVRSTDSIQLCNSAAFGNIYEVKLIIFNKPIAIRRLANSVSFLLRTTAFWTNILHNLVYFALEISSPDEKALRRMEKR